MNDDSKRLEKSGAKPKKKYLVLLIVFALVVAANHGEYYVRKKALADKNGQQGAVVVKAEDGMMGHSSLGIDESETARKSNKTFLRFSTLGTWDYDPEKKTPCPENVQALTGQRVSCLGFMYPLETGTRIRLYALLRTTQTCCYGPRPQYNQYLYVESKEPVTFERVRPVMVDGVFYVDPKPEEGYIYRMDQATAKTVKDRMPDINATQAAEQAHLDLFDFSVLEKMKHETVSESHFPELYALRGKRVVVEGFQVGSAQSQQSEVMVGKYWWDGVMQGTPPDLYNAVMVFPKDESQVPPAWKQKVVFTGVLNITHDKNLYTKEGIVSIKDAVRGVPGQTGLGGGPLIPVRSEAVILFILCIMAAYERRTKRNYTR